MRIVLETVTVEDFTQIFDSFAEFLECLLAAKLELLNTSATKTDEERMPEVDLLIYEFDSLLQKRPLLLNSVKLRQNPNYIEEWLKRVRLRKELGDELFEQLAIYKEAVESLDFANKFQGDPADLYIAYVACLLSQQNWLEAKKVFVDSLEISELQITSKIKLILAFTENLLLFEDINKAKTVLGKFLLSPKNLNNKSSEMVECWMLMIDLELCSGSTLSCLKLYKTMLASKVMTPLAILAFSKYFEEQSLLEESFRVYETGIDLFKGFVSKEIFVLYLVKIRKQSGPQMHSIRALFEQLLNHSGPDDRFLFVLLQVKFETEVGLNSSVLNAFSKAEAVLSLVENYKLFVLKLTYCLQKQGILFSRQIFSQAVNKIQDLLKDTSENVYLTNLCVYFAKMENLIGETDRARSIFLYFADFADPISNQRFWKSWYELEVESGSKSTFTDMLRVKRSISQRFTISQSFVLESKKN